jgi:hypothetical protein
MAACTLVVPLLDDPTAFTLYGDTYRALTPGPGERDLVGDEPLLPRQVLRWTCLGRAMRTRSSQPLVSYDGTYYEAVRGLLTRSEDVYDAQPAWKALSTSQTAWICTRVVPTGVCPAAYQEGVVRTLSSMVANYYWKISAFGRFLVSLLATWNSLPATYRPAMCDAARRVLERDCARDGGPLLDEMRASVGTADFPTPLLATLLHCRVFHTLLTLSGASCRLSTLVEERVVAEVASPCHELLGWVNSWARPDTDRGGCRSDGREAARLFSRLGTERAVDLGLIKPASVILATASTPGDLLVLLEPRYHATIWLPEIARRLYEHPAWVRRSREDERVFVQAVIEDRQYRDYRHGSRIDALKEALERYPGALPARVARRARQLEATVVAYLYLRYPGRSDIGVETLETLLTVGTAKARAEVQPKELLKAIYSEIKERGPCSIPAAVGAVLVRQCCRWTTVCANGDSNRKASNLYYDLLTRLVTLMGVPLPGDVTLGCEHCLARLRAAVAV